MKANGSWLKSSKLMMFSIYEFVITCYEWSQVFESTAMYSLPL